MKLFRILICCLFCVQTLVAQVSKPPALAAIKEEEIKKDLFDMAADHFRGREAGTLDELKVSMWLANQAAKAGLEPAGDDNTFFQFFSLVRTRVSPASTIKIGENVYKAWQQVLITQTAQVSLNAPLLFISNPTKDELDKADVKGKAVAFIPSPEGINLNVSLPERRYLGYVSRKYSADLIRRGAAAIIFIADDYAEKSWAQSMPALQRGSYNIPGASAGTPQASRAPILWLHGAAAESLKTPGQNFTASIYTEQFEYPSVNVVGKIAGKDPVLSKEYVLFSGHQDHDGVRQPYNGDSIYNGADDNASVSVALLAIARAFHKQPGRRSALFVWHGAEERGLLGSRFYAANPTVDRSSIVAVLNGDMIGRNTPDSAALLGVQPPHRNSAELVAMAMSSNQEGPKFKLDTLWDKASHNEGWYFRSDHLSYARVGIPSLFYTTLLHPDYHTPMDEASRIDIKKIAKVADWMYRTGWKVASTENVRPLIPGLNSNDDCLPPEVHGGD